MQRAAYMNPIMNNTKWDELRASRCELEKPSPMWRTKILSSGFESGWESEWFYHFKDGGYDDLEWVEIRAATVEQNPLLHAALRTIHLPGIKTDVGFKVFGHVLEGALCEYM